MDKEQRYRAYSRTAGEEEAECETASKLADKTRELNARKKTWIDRRRGS